MQPIFLKELIPHRDLLELKGINPYEEESKEEEVTKEDQSLAGFDSERSNDGRFPVSPASITKRGRNTYASKEIEMKSIIFN
jgi:hypothetical protein